MDSPNPLTQLLCRLNNLFARLFRKKRISNEDFLYRRIHPEWQKGETKISTAAFTHFDLSVDLASLTTAESAWSRAHNKDWGLARVSVAAIRNLPVAEDLKQEVRHSPEMCNWAHTLVIGKKTGKVQNKMREQAEVIIHTAQYRSGASSGVPHTQNKRP